MAHLFSFCELSSHLLVLGEALICNTIQQFWVKKQVALGWPPQIHRVAPQKEKWGRVRRLWMALGQRQPKRQWRKQNKVSKGHADRIRSVAGRREQTAARRKKFVSSGAPISFRRVR